MFRTRNFVFCCNIKDRNLIFIQVSNTVAITAIMPAKFANPSLNQTLAVTRVNITIMYVHSTAYIVNDKINNLCNIPYNLLVRSCVSLWFVLDIVRANVIIFVENNNNTHQSNTINPPAVKNPLYYC